MIMSNKLCFTHTRTYSQAKVSFVRNAVNAPACALQKHYGEARLLTSERGACEFRSLWQHKVVDH